MNTEYQLQQIKAIPIADYLNSLGIQIVKPYGGYALYNAPIVKTTTPASKWTLLATSGMTLGYAEVVASSTL